ncbi:hypothetical protein EVAR_47453_1 [Eumeta japonica]|uniref:Uncharacterized protein n=1 Tax=Eumeta variegata TaxID=151549 RepID=A0A4C1XEV0_EUMVA|nr:hypothetical protein EVAR_47453_1 [Eumeta japonica]
MQITYSISGSRPERRYGPSFERRRSVRTGGGGLGDAVRAPTRSGARPAARTSVELENGMLPDARYRIDRINLDTRCFSSGKSKLHWSLSIALIQRSSYRRARRTPSGALRRGPPRRPDDKCLRSQLHPELLLYARYAIFRPAASFVSQHE